MLIVTALLEDFIILTFQPGTPGWHKQDDRVFWIGSILKSIPAGKSKDWSPFRRIPEVFCDDLLLSR